MNSRRRVLGALAARQPARVPIENTRAMCDAAREN
jgi:hypothetical protein